MKEERHKNPRIAERLVRLPRVMKEEKGTKAVPGGMEKEVCVLILAVLAYPRHAS
jgi:hypothetical protein